MITKTWMSMGLAMFFGMAGAAMAGEATTSATAGSTGYGPGTAAATANYFGDGIGFTRTKANSGSLNFARGLSVGFDEDGLSLSHSYAVAPTRGPAVGGTMNLHIGLDGEASMSVGHVRAEGDPARSVTAGGSASGYRGSSEAISAASGRTGPRGAVVAETRSANTRTIASRPHERYRRPVGRPAWRR